MTVLTPKCITCDWLIGWLQTVCIYPGNPTVQRGFFLSLCVPVTVFSFMFIICLEIDMKLNSSYVWILLLAFTEEVPNIWLLLVFEGLSQFLRHFKKCKLLQNPYTYAIWTVKLLILKFLWQSLMHSSSIAASIFHLKACCHALRLGKPGSRHCE